MRALGIGGLRGLTLTSSRTMSWVLGRTTVSLSTAGISGASAGVADDYVGKTVELYEISRHIIATQTHTNGDIITNRLGLPKFCYSKPSYCAAVIEFESCLDRWETTRLKPLSSPDSNFSPAQNLSIHLR